MAHKIIGIGNAIVDFLSKSDDDFLKKLNVENNKTINEIKNPTKILFKYIRDINNIIKKKSLNILINNIMEFAIDSVEIKFLLI